MQTLAGASACARTHAHTYIAIQNFIQASLNMYDLTKFIIFLKDIFNCQHVKAEHHNHDYITHIWDLEALLCVTHVHNIILDEYF